MNLLRLASLPLTLLASVAYAQTVPLIASPVTLSPSGKLVYYAISRGDRVPDFSKAGYMGGGVRIPTDKEADCDGGAGEGSKVRTRTPHFG